MLKGKSKISDVKITMTGRGARRPTRFENKEMQGQSKPHRIQDPEEAITALARKGFEAKVGPAESQSFPISGGSTKGNFREFHVEFDGAVCKIKLAGLQRATRRMKRIAQARRAKMGRKNTAGGDQFNMDVPSGSAETSWSPRDAAAN